MPVPAELRPLLPQGLPRGGTVAVSQDGGASMSALLLLLSAASRAGAWCAVVGLPSMSPVAAEELGISLERCALVPEPGADWDVVTAALLDGVDIVVSARLQAPPAAVCGRLSARARQRGTVLVPYGAWQGADLTLQVEHAEWDGLQQGRGRLQCRQVTAVTRGRGAAARPRRTTFWLPEPSELYTFLRGRAESDAPRRLTAVPAAPAADPVPGPTPERRLQSAS